MIGSKRTILALALASLAAFVGAELALRIGPSHGVRPASEASSEPPAEFAEELVPGLQSATKIPAKLPEFTLQDLTGARIPIDRWRGKSLMINFWATWCPPCTREIPLLQAIHTEKAGHDIEVIGIAVDYPDKVRAFAQKYGIRYPLLVGEQDALDVAARLGVVTPAFPFTVFTDRRGAVVALYMGELKRPDVDIILRVVDALNQNRIDLPAARQQITAGLTARRAHS